MFVDECDELRHDILLMCGGTAVAVRVLRLRRSSFVDACPTTCRGTPDPYRNGYATHESAAFAAARKSALFIAVDRRRRRAIGPRSASASTTGRGRQFRNAQCEIGPLRSAEGTCSSVRAISENP